ncbi:MAG: hypothetical protein JSS49_05395 [Planctomycetes bacterium]|nr:hypothetical protein [Planctomycetota bacterium]
MSISTAAIVLLQAIAGLLFSTGTVTPDQLDTIKRDIDRIDKVSKVILAGQQDATQDK